MPPVNWYISSIEILSFIEASISGIVGISLPFCIATIKAFFISSTLFLSIPSICCINENKSTTSLGTSIISFCFISP